MKAFRIILSTLILFMFLDNHAQLPFLNDVVSMDNNLISDRATGTMIDLTKASGSPYLNPDFSKGTLVSKSDGETLEVLIRYNVLSDNFEVKFKESEREVSILERSDRLIIELLEKDFLFIQHPVLFGNTNLGYIARITSDEAPYTLYKVFFPKYTEALEPTSSYDEGSPARIAVKSKFYLKNNAENEYVELEEDRKDLLNAFSADDAEKIKSFMKDNKFKLRGSEAEVEKEMKAIIEFYNKGRI